MIKDSYGNTRFFGTYRGIVVDNKDPLIRNRLQLKVPQIFGNISTEWAWPVVPSGALFATPAIGDGVWVQFEGGDASFPIWVGTFEGVGAAPTGGLVGPTGPTGPAGTSGTNGTNGDTGPQGPAGIASATSPITVTGPTGAQTIGINQSAIAIAASQVTSGLSGTYAPLASPALTGTPTAPTVALTNDSTQIATTAFVKNVIPYAIAAGTATMDGDGTSSLTVTITFPALEFTQPPIVTVGSGNGLLNASVQSITTSGATVILAHINASNWSAIYYLQWIAIQMTSSSASGGLGYNSV